MSLNILDSESCKGEMIDVASEKSVQRFFAAFAFDVIDSLD